MAKTAGYSGTGLAKKLGIKPTSQILLKQAPDNYFDWMETNIRGQLCRSGSIPDIIHVFAKDHRQFEKEMHSILPYIKKNSAVSIWVSWYKKSAGIPTDLTEDRIRQYALSNGLVDIKVCAVTDEWSGLKLVVPLAKRS